MQVRSLVLGLVGLAGLSCISLAQADIYRWVDDYGKIHYSDKPFSKASGKTQVALKPTNIDTSNATQASMALVFPKLSRSEKTYLAQKASAQHASSVRRCSRAQDTLSMLSGPVTLHDAQGKVIEMTELQRQQKQLQQANKVSRLGC